MRRSHAPGSITVPEGTREELRAYRDDVIAGVGRAGRDLVDVRSPEEFSGELAAPAHLPQEAAQRRGHIPGAVNVPWATAVAEDGTFKPIDQLRELYGAKGVDGSDEVVAYCRIGERSSHTWFVLHELLGYENVRNYDGSWTEYGSLVGVPIETGGRGLTPRPRLVGPAPEGMPDPHLVPPQLARSGDPFAALRIVHFVSRLRRNQTLQLRDVVAALNAEYLDWYFSEKVVLAELVQLQANWASASTATTGSCSTATSEVIRCCRRLDQDDHVPGQRGATAPRRVQRGAAPLHARRRRLARQLGVSRGRRGRRPSAASAAAWRFSSSRRSASLMIS